MDEDNAVAVIGIGCRFPGANNKEEFWRVIINGENHVVEIQNERSGFKHYYTSDPNDPEAKTPYKAGLVKRFSHWDNKVFGVTDQEAVWIDPQQRFVLDCVHMAIEDAGLTRRDLNGTNTGVYIGVMNDDFKQVLRESAGEFSSFAVTGVNTSIISARISYVFNLHGPSMTIDTACSSSLVAIHQGALALKAGDCDMAICGGVNIILDPNVFETLSFARMLSPTGQCHSFTSKADGYARGEGCGIVMLKRAKDVLESGNHIWGLLATGVNQDGHMAAPITAPSGQQQRALLQRVYENFNVPKSLIQVIEAHGTGTAIGDPTECNALGHFFYEENSSSVRYIGSVKSNIGHLESAAGIAGLIKVLLMMHYETIAPSLHVEEEGINPQNNLTENGLTVPTKPVEWILPNGGTRMACVNSFGFGGTNAHAIVQEYKRNSVDEVNSTIQNGKPVIILLSGTSQDALTENVSNLIERLNEKRYNMDELSFTSACKRDHFPIRVGFIASNQLELSNRCKYYLKVEHFKMSRKKQKPRVVMVFCGVGTVWQGMCSELISNKSFRTALLDVDRLLKEHTVWSVAEKMKSNEVIQDPMVSQIAIFACQVSLVEMWRSCGISPDVVVGQSVGEVAAAYASGTIGLKTAVEIIYKRSSLLSKSTGGKMMVVSGLDISRLQNMCESQPYSICLAVHNSPSSATISGDAEGIAALKKEILRLNEKGEHILSNELQVTCAYHSHHVESAKNDFLQSLSKLDGKEPRVQIVSTVTGKYAKNGDFITADYWSRNIRDEVRFYEAIQMAASEKTTTLFLEIGPHPVLAPHLDNIFPLGHVMALPSMKKKDENMPWKETLVELYQHGLDINWEAIIPTTSKFTDIPNYTFLGKAFLPQGMHNMNSLEKTGDSHLYVRHDKNINDRKSQYKVTISDKDTAFVYEHIVKGSVIVPGAFYADIGLEIGRKLLHKPIQELQVELEFLKTLRLKAAAATDIDITAELSESILGELCCEFQAQSEGNIRTKGSVKTSSSQCHRQHDIADIKSRFWIHLTKGDVYNRLENYGFKYGESFRLIEECSFKRGESFAKLRIPQNIVPSLAKTHIHPVILDGMLQTGALTIDERGISEIKNPLLLGLPVGVDSLKVIKSSWSQVLYSYVRVTDSTITETQFENHAYACLMDGDGHILVEIQNLTCFAKLPEIMVPRELKYFMTAKSFPLPEEQVIVEGPANVVVIHGDKIRNDSFGLDSSNTISICPQSFGENIKTTLLTAVISKWGSNDVISKVIFLPGSPTSNDKVLDGLQVMETAKWNCLLFVEVIKALSDLPRHPPVFVITENTQGLDNMSTVPVTVCGAELWGQIRCLLRELVYVNVFLVDVVDMKVNESLLKTLLSQPFKNLEAFPPETVLTKGKLYAIEIHSASSRDCVSPRRAVCQRPKEDTLLQAECYDPIMDLYLIPNMEDEKDEIKPGWVRIEVQSVCLSASLEHMSNEPDIDFGPSRRDDEERGIQSLEITGYVEYADMYNSSLMQKLYRDCKPDIHSEESTISDKVKVVVCYPVKVGSFVKVPKACIVRQDEIPKYSPGQLCSWIRTWTLLQLVQKKKKIGIFCDDDEEFHGVNMVDIFQRIGCPVEVLHLTRQKDEMYNNKKVEIAILLTPLKLGQEQCFLEYLKGSRQLIALKRYLRRSLQDKIVHAKVTSCKFVDERDIFSRENLPGIIPKVVTWIKRGKLSSPYPPIGETTCELLPQVVNIMPISGKCSLKRKVKESQLFDKHSSYIVVGGLTGLGWILLELLAEKGAGMIVSFSRRGLLNEKEEAITKIKTQHGCNILCLKADVSDMNSLRQGFEELGRRFPKLPIRGIFQGAASVDSRMFLEMTSENFDTVMLPKVAGSWNLHLLSLNLQLDYFVMHSSISGIFGAGGDSNYGAANTYLDSLAHYRRKKGLPGQSIDWGGLHVGLAATDRFAKNFESKGYLRMNEEQIRKCFVHALMQDLPQVVYTILDWDIISKTYIQPGMERLAFRIDSILKYKNLKTTDQTGANKDQPTVDWQAFHCADRSARLRIALDILSVITCGVTNRDASDLQAEASLVDIGIDSLSAIHYINIISDVFKCKVPATKVLSPDFTLQVLAEYLVDTMDVEKIITSRNIFQTETGTKVHKHTPLTERNGSASILDVSPKPDAISTKL